MRYFFLTFAILLVLCVLSLGVLWLTETPSQNSRTPRADTLKTLTVGFFQDVGQIDGMKWRANTRTGQPLSCSSLAGPHKVKLIMPSGKTFTFVAYETFVDLDSAHKVKTVTVELFGKPVSWKDAVETAIRSLKSAPLELEPGIERDLFHLLEPAKLGDMPHLFRQEIGDGAVVFVKIRSWPGGGGYSTTIAFQRIAQYRLNTAGKSGE